VWRGFVVAAADYASQAPEALFPQDDAAPGHVTQDMSFSGREFASHFEILPIQRLERAFPS
jgi:hypothetical protein